jgi:hypothetical protein
MNFAQVVSGRYESYQYGSSSVFNSAGATRPQLALALIGGFGFRDFKLKGLLCVQACVFESPCGWSNDE